MARIEKTVFISYRRTDVYTALAVYENLKNQGYDVFFDYRSISSGDFEQIITSNIRARAHFLLVLTPTALDRCNEPGDWLRREIELAIDEKRNIVPLFFKGFRFGGSSKPRVSKLLGLGKPDVLTGKLKDLSRYNGLNVHEDYFEEAMQRVRTEFLSKPLDTVLHPVSTQIRKMVKEEQDAADEALKHKEEIKSKIEPSEEQPVQKKETLKPVLSKPEKKKIASPVQMKVIPWRKVGGIAGALTLIALCLWGGVSLWSSLSLLPEPTEFSRPTATETLETVSASTLARTATPRPLKTNTPSVTPSITPSWTPSPDLSNPLGEPLSVWKDIPIMPQAINGSDSFDETRYSFTVDVAPLEIANYYGYELKKVGWTSAFGWAFPGTVESGGFSSYSKDGEILNITISANGDLYLVSFKLSNTNS